MRQVTPKLRYKFTEAASLYMTSDTKLKPYRLGREHNISNIEEMAHFVHSNEEYSQHDLTKVNLLFMTYDPFVGAGADRILVQIHHTRTIIDESHVLHTDSSWRRSMERVSAIVNQQAKPFLMMTSNCPPEITQTVADIMHPSPLAMVRMPTNRLNIRYEINKLDREQATLEAFKQHLINLVKSSPPQPDCKWIIFVATKNQVQCIQDVYKSFGLPEAVKYYVGSLEREASFDLWRSGKNVGIIHSISIIDLCSASDDLHHLTLSWCGLAWCGSSPHFWVSL
jgi:superfamily II DNA helicase RecQ